MRYAAAALLLAGCGTAALDGSNSVTTPVDLPSSPEAAYTTTLRAMRACYNDASIRLEADWYAQAQQGSIRLSWFNSAGLIELAKIDFAASSGGTKVTHTTRQAAQHMRDAVSSWLAGRSDKCPTT